MAPSPRETAMRKGSHPTGKGPRMPRFSANLGFLWTELPLLDRIDAAARAGFRAVELHPPTPPRPPPSPNAAPRRGSSFLGINTDVNPAKGEAGLAAVPGRGAEARALIDQAFDWAAAAGGTGVHVMAGKVAPEELRRRPERARRLARARRQPRRGDRPPRAPRAAQPPRHAGLLLLPDRRGDRRSSTRSAARG